MLSGSEKEHNMSCTHKFLQTLRLWIFEQQVNKRCDIVFHFFFHTSSIFEIMGTISSRIRQDKSRQTLEITRGRGKNRCDEPRTFLVFLQIIKRSHSSDMLIAGAPPKTLDVCNVPEDIIIATEKGMMCENLLGRRPDGRLPDGMLRGRTLRRQDLETNSNANGKLHVRWKGMDA
jgi:hypothetical protein